MTVGLRVAVGRLVVAVGDAERVDAGVGDAPRVDVGPGVAVWEGVAVGVATGLSTGRGDVGQNESGTIIGSTPWSRRTSSMMSARTAPMTVKGHGL